MQSLPRQRYVPSRLPFHPSLLCANNNHAPTPITTTTTTSICLAQKPTKNERVKFLGHLASTRACALYPSPYLGPAQEQQPRVTHALARDIRPTFLARNTTTTTTTPTTPLLTRRSPWQHATATTNQIKKQTKQKQKQQQLSPLFFQQVGHLRQGGSFIRLGVPRQGVIFGVGPPDASKL
jgi:hypothetical protein